MLPKKRNQNFAKFRNELYDLFFLLGSLLCWLRPGTSSRCFWGMRLGSTAVMRSWLHPRQSNGVSTSNHSLSLIALPKPSKKKSGNCRVYYLQFLHSKLYTSNPTVFIFKKNNLLPGSHQPIKLVRWSSYSATTASSNGSKAWINGTCWIHGGWRLGKSPTRWFFSNITGGPATTKKGAEKVTVSCVIVFCL